MTATSSQRLNLRPTWRSTPTSSKPHAACRHRDASPPASMRANTRGTPSRGRCRPARSSSSAPDAPARCGRGGRRPSPRRWCGRRPAPCTATATRSRRPDRPRAVTVQTATIARERPGPGGQPRPLVVERPRDEVERRRARGDLAVVDLHDRLGVVGGRQSDRASAVGGDGTRRSAYPARVAGRADASPGGNVTPRGVHSHVGSRLCRAPKYRPLSSVGRAQPW